MKPLTTLAARATWLLLIGTSVWCGSAHAGRPLATEDAGVLAEHDCEWEAVAARLNLPGTESENALANQVACGTPWRTQIALAHVAARADEQTAQDVILGGKTLLWGDDDSPLALTLAYGLSWGKAGSESFRPSAQFANLVTTIQPTEGWTLHLNAGWCRDPVSDTSTHTWSTAVEMAFSPTVDVGAEYLGAEHSLPQWGVGLRYTPSDTWSFNLGYLEQTGPARAQLVSAGLKFAF